MNTQIKIPDTTRPLRERIRKLEKFLIPEAHREIFNYPDGAPEVHYAVARYMGLKYEYEELTAQVEAQKGYKVEVRR